MSELNVMTEVNILFMVYTISCIIASVIYRIKDKKEKCLRNTEITEDINSKLNIGG